MLNPIWQDTYYSANTSKLEYRVVLDGAVIFNGRAYRMPSDNFFKININKICQNYLDSDIDLIVEGASSQTQPNACRTFNLYNNDTGVLLNSYVFLNDWSYEDIALGVNNLSHPVNGHWCDGMLKLKTTINSSNVVSTAINNSAYNKKVNCCEWALYYLNAYGGWDSFLIEGKTIKSDNINQHTYTRTFSNTTKSFENSRYIAEIKTVYRLNTGLLTDDEANILVKNLMGSNKVYLHNLDTMEIKPVILTDTNVEYKTLYNNQRFAQYTINCEESQTKIRK